MPTAVVGETFGISKPIGPRPISPEDMKNIDSGRESLQCCINRLYGEETYKLIRRLEGLRRKKSQLLCSLTFLLRCRDNNVVPNFLRQKRVFSTRSSHRIYDRTEKALLRERIHQNRRDIAATDKDLYGLHLQISNALRMHDWDNVDRITYNTMMSKKKQISEKQIQKYNRLTQTSKAPPTLDLQRTVVNLSDLQLSPEETSLLAKGGNYAVTPTTVPVEDIISKIESGIRTLPTDEAELIRRESSRILHRAKPPKNNLSYAERAALRKLNNNDDLIILAADKGNATVVLNKTDYKNKIKDILDPNVYRQLPRDPTSRILRRTNQLLKESSIPEEKQRLIKKSEAIAPRLYGLPKIHKQEVPLRPIVSAIGSPTYALSKYLCSLLRPHIGKTDTFIKDSTHFVEKLKTLTIQPGDLLVSFDVVSLFTMVPVTETLALLQKRFPADITGLFHHVLTTTYFVWEGEFYEQEDGVAMGNPLSPMVANLYMENFEATALNTAPRKPNCWLRYVDDTFIIWSHGEETLEEFRQHLNSIHPRIQFTIEREQNGQLPFLDVLVNKKEDGSLGHKVFRKVTHTDRYLNKMSNHHPSQKRAMMKTLVHRASRICEDNNLHQELGHLENVLQANGYSSQEVKRALHPNKSARSRPEDEVTYTVTLPYLKNVTDRISKILKQHKIKTIFTPTTQLHNMFRSAKDRRNPLMTAGVYRIPCSCGSVYIGTTQRSVNTRLTEHKRNCRFGYTERSAVAEHALSGKEHDILFHNTEILSSINHYHARLQREAIEIFKHPNNFNRKEEGVKISSAWLPVLQNTKVKPYNNDNPCPTSISVDTQSQTSSRSDSQSEASARNLPLHYPQPQPINGAAETNAASRQGPPASPPPPERRRRRAAEEEERHFPPSLTLEERTRFMHDVAEDLALNGVDPIMTIRRITRTITGRSPSDWPQLMLHVVMELLLRYAHDRAVEANAALEGAAASAPASSAP